MPQIQDTLCQLLRKEAKEKPSQCKAARGSTSGCCRGLHCTTKKIKHALTELNPTVTKNPSSAKLSLLSGLNEVASLLLEHKCPNVVVVAVCGEVVKVLHSFISSTLLEEYKLYGRLYSLVRDALPSLKSVLNAQVEYWKLVTDSDRDSTINAINEALAQLDATFALYTSKEQDFFGFLDTMRQNKTVFRVLDAEIQKVFLKTAQGIQVAERQNSVILADLREQFSDCWAENVYVDFTPFGSRISRLGGEESDLDVSMSLFSFNEDTGERNFLPIVIDNRFSAPTSKPSASSKQILTSTILKTLRRRCSRPKTLFRCHEFIPKARIPIVKLVHVGTGVEVDICIENQLGVQNTMLLQAYTRADPRVHALLLAVKVWAKNRCLNQASQGTISTFSWCLLVIYYLHNVVTPTVAPAFQPSTYGANLLRDLHEAQSYGTEHCSELIFELLALPPAPPVPIAQRVTTAELLCGFFAFYGIDCPDGFDFEREEINIRLNQRSVGGTGKIEDDEDEDDNEEGGEDDEDAGEGGGGGGDEVHDGAGISDAEDGGLEVSMTRATTRNKAAQSHQWRLKIRDPFVDWDLGRCIRSKEAQMFIQEEVRRAFMLIYHRLASDSSVNSVWTAISERNAELPNGFCTCVRCHVVGHSKLNCPKSKPFKGGNDNDAANGPPTTPGKAFQRPGPGYEKAKTPFKGNDRGTAGFKSPAATTASATTTPSTARGGNKFDQKASEAPPSTSKSASKAPKTPKTPGTHPAPTTSSEPTAVEKAINASPTKGSAVKPPKLPVSEKKIKGKAAQMLADTFMAASEVPVPPPPVVTEKKSTESESPDDTPAKTTLAKEEKKKAKKVKKAVESATEATVVEVKVSAVVEAAFDVSVDATKTEKLNKTPLKKQKKVTAKGEKAAVQPSTGDLDVSAIISSLAALELSTTATASTDPATAAPPGKMTRKERRAHLQRDGERLVAAVAEAAANDNHPSGAAAAVSTVLAPYTDEALPKREKTSKARRRERREKERAETGTGDSVGEAHVTET